MWAGAVVVDIVAIDMDGLKYDVLPRRLASKRWHSMGRGDLSVCDAISNNFYLISCLFGLHSEAQFCFYTTPGHAPSINT